MKNLFSSRTITNLNYFKTISRFYSFNSLNNNILSSNIEKQFAFNPLKLDPINISEIIPDFDEGMNAPSHNKKEEIQIELKGRNSKEPKRVSI